MKVLLATGVVVSAVFAADLTIASSIPTNVAVQPGDAEFTVSFTAPTEQPAGGPWTLQGFRITVLDDEGTQLEGPISCSDTTNPIECTISALSNSDPIVNGSSYAVEVQARWADDDTEQLSSASARSDLVTPYGVPDRPALPTAAYGTGDPATTAEVTWTKPANNGSTITRYQVYIYDASGSTRVGPDAVAGNGDDTTGCEAANADTLTCEVTGLAANAQVTFTVLAENQRGDSLESPTSATFTTPPGAPSGVLAANDPASGDITVTWSAPSGASPTGYTAVLFDGSTEVATGVWTSGALSFTFDFDTEGLAFGTQYTARVSAQNTSSFDGVDGIGFGARSSASPAAISSTTPATPATPTGTAGPESVVVSWTAPESRGSSIQRYEVQAYQGGQAVEDATCQSAATLSCTISGLDELPYTFTVVAVNANGSSTESSASAPVTPNAALQAQTITVTSQPSGSVNLSDGSASVTATALGGAVLVFTSTTTNACRVDDTSTGTITLVAPGTCSVTIATEATATYSAGNAGISFTIVDDTSAPEPDPLPDPTPQPTPDPVTDPAPSPPPVSEDVAPGDQAGADESPNSIPTRPTTPAPPSAQIVNSLPETTLALSSDSDSSTPTIDVGSPIELVFPAGTFDPVEWVSLSLHSDPVALGLFLSDSEGGLTAEVSIPVAVETGQHTLVGIGQVSERGARAVVLVEQPISFSSVEPARVLNTRSGVGAPVGRVGELDGSGSALVLQVAGRGGVPASGVSAVALNVTVVDGDTNDFGGFVTVFPCDVAKPDVSNLNFVSGQTVPNSVVAPLSAAGTVCLYVYGTAHLLVDVSGYM